MNRFAGVICIVLGMSESPLFAGFTVNQVVETKINQKTQTAKYTWHIDDKKFKLTVSSKHGEVSYLFNGKNFYVCSKLTSGHLKALGQYQIKNKEIIEKLQNGSCQSVPTNFMARFFVSPAAAISNLDYSDGLRLSLSLKDYQFNPEKKMKAAAGRKCKVAKRQFTVERKIDAKSHSHQMIDETICYGKVPNWRTAFWKEISKQLIRQPQARALYKGIKEDSQSFGGFVLASDGSFQKSDEKGQLRKGKRKTRTKSIAKTRHNPRIFQIPASYQIIDLAELTSETSHITSQKSLDDVIEKDPVPKIIYFNRQNHR